MGYPRGMETKMPNKNDRKKTEHSKVLGALVYAELLKVGAPLSVQALTLGVAGSRLRFICNGYQMLGPAWWSLERQLPNLKGMAYVGHKGDHVNFPLATKEGLAAFAKLDPVRYYADSPLPMAVRGTVLEAAANDRERRRVASKKSQMASKRRAKAKVLAAPARKKVVRVAAKTPRSSKPVAVPRRFPLECFAVVANILRSPSLSKMIIEISAHLSEQGLTLHGVLMAAQAKPVMLAGWPATTRERRPQARRSPRDVAAGARRARRALQDGQEARALRARRR